jgi:predicted ATPase
VVAQVLGEAAAEVEERLDVLERVNVFVRRIREQTFPDRTLTVRYGFVHVLYQNALYAALQPTRKAEWSAATADALSRHYGEKTASIATELVPLFEAARDRQRAADYCLIAARNAARVFAHHEAVELARRGLTLLRSVPDTPERARCELPLLVTLGIQLQFGQGYAAPEVEPIYARARTLHEQVPDVLPLFSILWGIWMFYEVGGEPRKSRELAGQLLALAERTQDPDQLIRAHQALSITSLCLGEPAAAVEHMNQGIALYDAKRDGNHVQLYGQDPPGVGQAFGAVALWLLGYPEQAVLCSREALALARDSSQPSTLALAFHFAAILHQYRREGLAVLEHAETAIATAMEHGLSFWLPGGSVMRGWALADKGECASGIAEARRGLASHGATGTGTYKTYYLAVLADALYDAGRFEEGLAALDEALARMQENGECYHGAELHRLKGEFLRRRQASTESAEREAEASFHQAVTIARQQQARSLELRALMSLTRLLKKQNRQVEARPLLSECYSWFTEGFDTPDLRDAKALLEQIA